MTIEITALVKPQRLDTLEQGDGFIDCETGSLYVFLTPPNSYANVKAFCLNRPSVIALPEARKVLKVNLKIQWELPC